MAAIGKSTIAQTIACKHLAQDQLGASFFFTGCNGDLGYASKFFTAIAFQLIQRSTALKGCMLNKGCVLKAVDENKIGRASCRERVF